MIKTKSGDIQFFIKLPVVWFPSWGWWTYKIFFYINWLIFDIRWFPNYTIEQVEKNIEDEPD